MVKKENEEEILKSNKIWKYYGFGAMAIILYTILMKPKEKVTKTIWVIYAFLAGFIGMYRNL